MENWALLTHILGLAIGAGVNLYAVVLAVGLGIRFGWVSGLPGELDVLAHPAVLAAAGLLYAAEFVADKVPFFTPIWDSVHTFIRPAGAALLALGAAADLDPLARTLAMLAAGTLALGAHSSKMGFRLMAHAAPEPASHSVISVLEDFGVVALLVLAYQYPWIALPVLIGMVAAIAAFVPLLVRIVRFLLAGIFGRVSAWVSGRPGERPPEWVAEPAGVVRAFARRVKGAPRLAPGWLRPDTGEYYFTRWGARKTLRLGALEPGVEWGFLYNVARTRDGASFYLTKEWCACLTREPSNTQA